MKNKWQIEYQNIYQRLTEIIDVYVAQFRKAISKVKLINLLLVQMQVIDFISGLWTDLAIITNESNPADLDKMKKIAKNMKNASLINKNIMAAAMNLAVAEVKELKA